MDVLKEQRVCIKFCQKLGKTATETYEMLHQAFGETVLSRSKTFEWYSRFKNGHKSIKDDSHTGQPSMVRTNETVDYVNAVIHVSRLLTIRETVTTPLRCIRRKWPHKWSSGTWLLHHNNVPCHAVLSVREFLAKHSIPMVPHLPYSPDLAPCDFFLFPRLKSTLKGKRFQDVPKIQLNTTQQLQAISKQAYQTCIEKWKDCWNRCIQPGGLYFEGDNFE
jgi:hypothetical protein